MGPIDTLDGCGILGILANPSKKATFRERIPTAQVHEVNGLWYDLEGEKKRRLHFMWLSHARRSCVGRI